MTPQPTSEFFRRRAGRQGSTLSDPMRAEGARSSAADAADVRGLREAGQLSTDTGPGPDGTSELYALEQLVRSGEISQADADAYLTQLRPAQQWSGRQYGGLADDAADATLLELERTARLRGGLGFYRSALDAQRVSGRRANRGTDEGAAGAQPYRVPALPETYERAAVQRALESVAEQGAQHARQIRTTPPDLPAHSVDGGVIRPGSLPVSALNLQEVGRQLLPWPRADEAVELQLVHATDLDRYVRTAAGESGPGRVWRARSNVSPGAARIGVGSTRYRIVTPGTRLGVMSMRLPLGADMAATANPGLLVQWGIVVTGIPCFLGRPPSRILRAEAVGDAPASLRSTFQTAGGSTWNSGGTTRDFFWARTQLEHLTNAPYPFAEAFGTDAVLAPDGPALRDLKGLSFQLLTGRNGGEVWRQLCSRETLGRTLRGDAHGPGASVPNGLTLEAPTCSTVVDWVTPVTNYIHRVEGYDLTTVKVANGIPFSYDDAEALVATETTFSLVVLAVGERLVSQAPAPTYGTPEVWHKNGVRTVESVSGRLRSWAVDIIVE